ncbi:MAG TPA: undecaprenyldiphospho-muramoylpentapeptide beta-N-acetylglucosaminyltransferase, partial [Gemmatimonadota bacterium]|nr:undecaprenyldiphospho-muramoylpentapeptide beta-N-acetylglucosaminyltransferase [Gemmatimonadota bacterium]
MTPHDDARGPGTDATDPGEVRVMIAGGGTGGHLMPALVLARELVSRPRPARVTLIGGDRGPDREVYGGSGLPYRILSAPRVERARWWRNAALPARLASAVLEARRLVAELDPHVVVGTGGYASAPPVMAAVFAKRPIVLQEQNSRPGLTTRFLARWADLACVQFESAAEELAGKTDVALTGSPIAPQVPSEAPFAGRLDPALATVGVFGGSQGARALNDALLGLAAEADVPRFNLVWQTGASDHARVAAARAWPQEVVIERFFSPMTAVYPLLDLIVCRAGAMTLAEVAAWGIPSVLVPYPHAADDHQTKNARALEDKGAAIVLPESELSARRLSNLIAGLLSDPGRRAR